MKTQGISYKYISAPMSCMKPIYKNMKTLYSSTPYTHTHTYNNCYTYAVTPRGIDFNSLMGVMATRGIWKLKE